MQVFINELSFIHHYEDGDLARIVHQMNAIIAVLSAHRILGETIAMYRTLEHEYIFPKSLSRIDKTIRERYKILLKSKVSLWRNSRFHVESDNYHCQEIHKNVTDTSLAEAAERDIQHHDTIIILNFGLSPFQASQLHVVKNATEQISVLPAFDDESKLHIWLAEHDDSFRNAYSLNSKYPPKDWQTCLKNKYRFERTQFRNKGIRRVFRELTTGYLFSVDNQHIGQASHLEVFNADFSHRGIADIVEGVVDESKAVHGRILQ